MPTSDDAAPRPAEGLATEIAAARGGDEAVREALVARLGVAARRRLGAALRFEGMGGRSVLYGICDDVGCAGLRRDERSQVMAIAAAAVRHTMVAAFARRRDDPQAAYVVALDDALGALHERDPTLATLVELAFFGGLEAVEVAEIMGTSQPTVERRWRFATAWLHRRIAPRSPGG